MALLSQGADGTTHRELRNGLRLAASQNDAAEQFFQYRQRIKTGKGDSTFTSANNIYVQRGYSINPQFQESAERWFSAKVNGINFADKERSAKEINGDVSDATNGKIVDLIKPDLISSDSRIVLVNAVYFQGAWEFPFKPNLTLPGDFKNVDGTKSKVLFMHNEKDYSYSFFRELNASMLEMKYFNSNLSMLIFLPNIYSNLEQLEGRLRNRDIAELVDRLVYDEVEVDLPRFTVEYEINLNDVLKKVSAWGAF